jgi:hypothetical protein
MEDRIVQPATLRELTHLLTYTTSPQGERIYWPPSMSDSEVQDYARRLNAAGEQVRVHTARRDGLTVNLVALAEWAEVNDDVTIMADRALRAMSLERVERRAS